eukprot:scaffold55509_cov69-Phaeocystis_antarctica.AAC.1
MFKGAAREMRPRRRYLLYRRRACPCRTRSTAQTKLRRGTKTSKVVAQHLPCVAGDERHSRLHLLLLDR